MTSLARIARGRLPSSALRSAAITSPARGVASTSVHASPAAETTTSSSSQSSTDTITVSSSASISKASSSSSSPASSSSKFAPLELPSPLEPAKTHPRTHGHHVATLHLRSHGPGLPLENLIFYTDFAVRSAYALGIPTSLPASLPMRKELWTVPKSPFVHKESQENFERRTHKRVIKVFDANDDVVERWLHWLRIHAMPGVGMRAEVYRSYPLGVGSQLLSQAAAQLRQTPASIPNKASPSSSSSSSDNVTAVAGDEAEMRRLADQILKEDLKESDEASAEQATKLPPKAAEEVKTEGKAAEASASAQEGSAEKQVSDKETKAAKDEPKKDA